MKSGSFFVIITLLIVCLHFCVMDMDKKVFHDKLKQLYSKKNVLEAETQRLIAHKTIEYSSMCQLKKRKDLLNVQIDYFRSKLLPDIIA